MVKLLVVDSHPIVRKGIELLFSNSTDIEVVETLDNGQAIFKFLQSNIPDIILSEIDLPKLNGITALRRLKKQYPHVKVIIYSAQPEDVYAISTIKHGAKGYIPKTADIFTLTQALLKVQSGEIYLRQDLKKSLSAKGKRYAMTKDGIPLHKRLSQREVEVLKLLSAGYKNKEIAQELKLNEKTVSTYKTRLMKKLKVSNLVDLLNKANLLEL